MTHTISEIIERWVDSHEHEGLRMWDREWHQNVYANGDNLYSYGDHFTLARKMSWGYLLNGERFSNTTSRHQAILRRVMQTGVSENNWRGRRGDADDPALVHAIIPFAALRASSIDIPSIELIEVQPDRWINREVRVTQQEIDEQHLIIRGTDLTDAPHTVVGTMSKQKVWPLNEHGAINYYAEPTIVERFSDLSWRYSLNKAGQIVQEVGQHQLGESLIKAKVLVRQKYDARGDGGRGAYYPVWRTAYFISAWDNQDTQTYFFSELPDACASLDEAYEMLKPQTVKFGEFENRMIVRQGDIFAVETDLTTKQLTELGAERKRMDYVHGTNHVVTEQATLPNGAVLGRGVLWHRPEGRRADHRRQVIGKKWAVIVKNTVPVTKRRGRRN